jgi:hypothetical protein
MSTFRQALIRGGWWDRALVIFTADHGESLGEHGEASHGYFIYESTLHVPLVIHWPATAAAPLPARVDRPVALLDVAPTILDYLHVPAPPTFAGRSLLDRTSRPVVAESTHAHDAFGWAPLRSIRVGDYKYIDAPKPELYNLVTDPAEGTNLIGRDPVRVQSMRTALAEIVARRQRPAGPVPTLSPQQRALLTSNGYLAPGPKSATPSGADPKDKLPEFNQYEDAEIALYKGHLAEAAAILRKIVATDPGNTLARRDLGSVYMEEKQYSRARTELEKVAAVAPDDYVTQYELSLILDHLHLPEQAATHKQLACSAAPDTCH